MFFELKMPTVLFLDGSYLTKQFSLICHIFPQTQSIKAVWEIFCDTRWTSSSTYTLYFSNEKQLSKMLYYRMDIDVGITIKAISLYKS